MGSAWLTATPAALDGPRLVTVKLYVSERPAVAVAAAAALTCRSECAATVTELVFELFVVTGSRMVEPTRPLVKLTTVLFANDAGALRYTTTWVEALAARPPRAQVSTTPPAPPPSGGAGGVQLVVDPKNWTHP